MPKSTTSDAKTGADPIATTAPAGQERGTASPVLVDARWLEGHLHDPGLRVIEVDVNPDAYNEGHIDGAVLWNIYTDLKDCDYRLVDKTAVEALLARSGIGPETVVVFYGYGPAIGFWLMKLYGHRDVRILNLTRGTWRDEGRPWSTGVATPAATAYRLGDEDHHIRASQPMVEDAITRPDCVILDVRSDNEYRGEQFWPSGGLEPGGRAGHIPSAVLLPAGEMLDDRGAYRSAVELGRLYAAVDLPSGHDVISYCTIGARACTAWFVLTYLLGQRLVRVYDGSWAEWGRTSTTPVERA